MLSQNSMIFLSSLFVYGFITVECKSLNDSKTLIRDLLVNYQKTARPVSNQDEPVNVTVVMYIKSIQTFDEVQEKFSYVAGLNINWMDDGIKWDPIQYGGLIDVFLSYRDVWVPELILINPSEEVKSFGEKWHTIRYYCTGFAVWIPGVLIETTCPVNARNYPFDTQVCTSSLSTLGYSEKEIGFISGKNEIELTIYSENGGWTLEKTLVETSSLTGAPQIDFIFHLKRKPAYVIINVLLPIIFLSFLNVLVFFLVPESGERVSYCITVMLSIAVFLTIISDTLPKSSEPVPIISYMLMVDMVISSLITFVTILNLRVYNKDENEEKPRWLVSFYICVFLHKIFRRNRVCPNTDVVISVVSETKRLSISSRKFSIQTLNLKDATDKPVDINSHDSIVRSVSHTCICDRLVTWKQISHMIDLIAFFGFSFLAGSVLVIFIVLTSV